MTYSSDQLLRLRQCAYRIRRLAVRMGEVQGQGYVGQALGYADVLAVAYGHAMTFRPAEPEWEGRDRFLLSHGHYAIAHYAALIEAGVVPESELETYGSDDSRLPMSGMIGLFDLLGSGRLRIDIAAHVPLHDAAQAHRLIEDRRTAGAIILDP